METNASGGDHRIEAHLRLGHKKIAAEVRQGTQLDAKRYGRNDNADHGLVRSIKTKKAQVLDALQDPDWQGWSYNAIANYCKVSWPFVKQVAQENGLHTSNVRSMEGESRTFIHPKTGQPTTMKTGNIGAHLQNGGANEGVTVTMENAESLLSILFEHGVNLDNETEWHGLMSGGETPYPMVTIKPDGTGHYDLTVVLDFETCNRTKHGVKPSWIIPQLETLGASPNQLHQMRWTKFDGAEHEQFGRQWAQSTVKFGADIREGLKNFAGDVVEMGQSFCDVKSLIDEGKLSADQYAEWLETEFDVTVEQAEKLVAVADAADADTDEKELLRMADEAWWGKEPVAA